QIEISQELLANYIDNYIKNISVKLDNKSIIYNSNNELSVPFDNDTIYYENNVWKAKQGGDIPSDVIKDSDLNKDYIDKEDGNLIIKVLYIILIMNYQCLLIMIRFIMKIMYEKQNKAVIYHLMLLKIVI
ncbi:hypothetical protein C6B38_02985, partial [Spiroplasma sp. ChiS]|uniref:hypothetical protein n=1 Tax=Spiroplasma sp. ChiS TaxID=2099885 RepID=UPI000D4F48A5